MKKLNTIIQIIGILIFTAKSIVLQSQVTEEWVRSYDVGDIDIVFDPIVTTDANGNIYVTGATDEYNGIERLTTIKYNSSGVEQWVKKSGISDRPFAIITDNAGNIYITGQHGTIKYNSSGVEQWAHSYSGFYSFGNCIAIDDSGNVFVTGFFENICATIKYNSWGDEIWRTTFGEVGLWPTGRSVAVDNSGNVFVSIGIYGPPSSSATIKYNSIGVEQWVRKSPDTGYNSHDIALDNSENIYVTTSFATTKYNTSGVQLWTRPGGNSIELETTGNVYISTGGSILKYSSSGNLLWEANETVGIRSMDIDSDGNVYTTGYFGLIPSIDYQTSKYNSSGIIQWTIRFDGTSHFYDLPTSLSVDQSGNVFVTGMSFNDFLGYTTIKYSQDNPLPVELISFTSSIIQNNVKLNWSTSSETNNSGFDIERSAVNGEWSKISFVQGNGTTSTPNNYEFTDKNLSSGKYNYRLKQIDFNGNFEYFNLSNEVEIGVPAKFELSQNYPNPFNPTTKISYDLPFDGIVNLTIFDITGKEVMNLINENKSAGYYEAAVNGSNLSSGVYFYRLILEGNGNIFTATKKMMLMK